MADLFAEVHDAVEASRRLREEVRRLREADRRRVLDEKTRPSREAAARDRQLRAELHRMAALPGLADRLAQAVFDHVEGNAGRPVVRDELATALLGVLMKSGIARDPRFPPTA
jgi:hypothetical protein